MDLPLALATLLHVLVLVYWLGGDVGAFYASWIVTDPARPVSDRRLALGIVNAVDLAPRVSLIAALPTGLLLANLTGWLAIPAPALIAAFGVGGAWIALILSLHRSHGDARPSLKNLDLAIRWVLLIGLVFVAGASVVGALPVPLFVGLKCALLAATIALGLRIRATLAAFGPAIATMITTGPTPEADATIARALGAARPLVLAIWACLVAAALLGLWKPLGFSAFLPT